VTAHHAHACPELPARTENLKLQATSPLPGRTGHCPSRRDGCRARQLPGARKCASASPALASIRSVILPPTRSRTCQQYRASQEQHDLQPAAARPTDRCRAEMPHSKHSLSSSRTAAGKYNHAAERVGWLDSTGQWRHGSRSCAERDDLSAYRFAMGRRPTRKYSAIRSHARPRGRLRTVIRSGWRPAGTLPPSSGVI
jgi:hypothetical protein